MAKKTTGKGPSFVCATCGKDFGGGIKLGKHYQAVEKCRPEGWAEKQAAKAAKKAADGAATLPFAGSQSAPLSVSAATLLAITAVETRIVANNQAIKEVDDLKAQVVEDKKRLSALEGTLDKATLEKLHADRAEKAEKEKAAAATA